MFTIEVFAVVLAQWVIFPPAEIVDVPMAKSDIVHCWIVALLPIVIPPEIVIPVESLRVGVKFPNESPIMRDEKEMDGELALTTTSAFVSIMTESAPVGTRAELQFPALYQLLSAAAPVQLSTAELNEGRGS